LTKSKNVKIDHVDQITSCAMHICICNNINEKKIQNALREGASDLKDVSQMLGLGSKCGKCLLAAKRTIDQAALKNLSAQAS
jgi:bacterioferritin-associated ferredoxin